MAALLETDFPSLALVSKGKVRDIYATSDPSTLLFVATDRISAYDVLLRNGIPGKGVLLNTLSAFWFDTLRDVVPNHMITTDVDAMPPDVRAYKSVLQGRAMLVRKAEVVPLEAIVRGYLTGSAWAEYSRSGTVHGIPLPPGLVESQRLPEPLFTPSTKAAQGQHDENLHPDQARRRVGAEVYARVAAVALRLYGAAARHAERCGLVLADTKFEFGLVPAGGNEGDGDGDGDGGAGRALLLIDELLTPDSSRYWPKEGYRPGGPQPSFDKQYVRDWLRREGFREGLEGGPEGGEGAGWVIEESVVEGTRRRYEEVVEKLMGSG